MLVVIADDFSGAAEIAGVARQLGLTAEVQTDNLRDSDCEVVVVDANTRSYPARSAANVMARLCPSIQLARPRLLFVKIDSLLRGPIVSQLESVSQGLDLQRCLLVNANPRRKRVIRDGRLLIGGQPIDQTVFAKDPEHPRLSSRVVELLNATVNQVQLVDPSQVVGGRLPKMKICVANAESTADLQRCAAAMDQQVLLAGAAEFFQAIMEIEYGTQAITINDELVLHRDTLLVRGTSIRDDFQGGPPINQLRTIELAGQSVEQAVKCVCQQLAEQGLAVLAISGQLCGGKSDNSNVKVARRHQDLVDVVRLVCARRQPQHLWIEGGRTASSIVRTLGWERMSTEAVYADGVVGLRGLQPHAPAIVVKPGSYNWPASQASH